MLECWTLKLKKYLAKFYAICHQVVWLNLVVNSYVYDRYLNTDWR